MAVMDDFHKAKWRICTCDMGNTPSFHRDATNRIVLSAGPDVKANARLIAAAPAMLEALKQCVFALDSAVMLQGLKELAPFAEQARAVIVRVEGE